MPKVVAQQFNHFGFGEPGSFSDTTVPLPDGFMEAMLTENRAQNEHVLHGFYLADTVQNDNVSHGCYSADTTYFEDE